jgi:hypothetical protein
MGFDKAIPTDAISLNEAYWEAARTLLPFMNQPATVIGSLKRSETKDREQFEKRWRLSLAGHDPMTGERSKVELQPFIIHPETHALLMVSERWKWLNRDEAVDVQPVVSVPTANGKINCLILINRKEFQQWLSAERGFPDAQVDAGSKSQAGPGAKARGIRQAINHLWPKGIPKGLSAKDRNRMIDNWSTENGNSKVSDRTIQRVLERLLHAT